MNAAALFHEVTIKLVSADALDPDRCLTIGEFSEAGA